MVLARRRLTAGDKRLITVSYEYWLASGVTLAAALVTDNSANLTISAITVYADYITFFVQGGVVNESITLSIQTTDSIGEIKNDTVELFVVAP